MKPDRKQISAALIEHLEREELHTGEAAKYLNLNPCYISMAKSEKSWDAMSTTAWNRLEEWFNTRENIKDFKIPEGEEIFVPKIKATGDRQQATGKAKETDEHSPANLIPEAKKEKPGKSVKLVINQAEMNEIRQDIAQLRYDLTATINGLTKTQESIMEVSPSIIETTKIGTKWIETITEKINEIENRLLSDEEGMNFMRKCINELQDASVNVSTQKQKEKPSKGIVIFQRNYFKS